MNIEEYFDHLAPDDIRIRGTRVGIESVLYEFIYREQPPEAIVRQFPSLTLEQVYATILFYLHNKQVIEAYMTEWLAFGQRMRTEQEKNPPPVVVRLRALKQQRQQAPAMQ
ncbi:MAG: DUF433 domain-containing protein [Deltaproteobacteria bacterium]|nr:DUF433 domain-containing protein [Deltaproteobacteria bacterium]